MVATDAFSDPPAPSPVDAGLRLVARQVPDLTAYVLANAAGSDDWQFVTGTADLPADRLAPLAGELRALTDRPTAVMDGSAVAYPLVGSHCRVGALVVCGSSLPDMDDELMLDARTCLAGELEIAEKRAEAAHAEGSARAIRRLFVEGADARDVRDAATVLGRVAADAFRTERAGIHLVDDDGVIYFASGVGVEPTVHRAVSGLVGQVAAVSPVWQLAKERGTPELVDDAATANLRAGGFVHTLGLRSFAMIPLVSQSGVLGSVVCGDASRSRTWIERERELAGQFALEAALIIDAARLRTRQREQLTLMSHQAHHDGLTGLANRRLLMSRLTEVVDACEQRPGASALLLLDLDDFKRVNDTLGHRYGDVLLSEVGTRLARAVGGDTLIARIGGDEFAVLLPTIDDGRAALAVADRIEQALAEPIDLDGIAVNAVASIGIALFTDRSWSPADLLQHADVAMYAAKRARAGAVVYDPGMNHATVERLSLHAELRSAVAGGELVLYHQPKLDLVRNTVVGVEALVRWAHPRRGLLGPGAFLPMAEQTELIQPLTAWVVSAAVRQWHEWHAAGLDLDIAVNVSARNLHNERLLAELADLLRRSGAARHFVFEVTETAVMNDPDKSIAALAELRGIGVRISMDDFGTGHSSLALLSQLPVDELKIDRALVTTVADSARDAALVDTIVHLGHRLGLKVVAEGIETPEMLRAVQDLGCDLGQGYLISRPVVAHDLVELINVRRLATAPDAAIANGQTTSSVDVSLSASPSSAPRLSS